MPANKQGRKSGKATPKNKTSAVRNAAQREQRQLGRAKPRTPRSVKRVSQSRYPGETPLTGEDRPAQRAGGKRGQGSRQKR